ncbi:histidine kinase [Nonomuraea sp. NPDC004580]|uniref:sensor histidine kinase n=1 Tax=Nonomuraea sp. NPDC004580 TaxID=3154552 RepID=UPI0033A59B3A
MRFLAGGPAVAGALALTLVLRPLPSPLVAVPALLTVAAMSLVWWPKARPLLPAITATTGAAGAMCTLVWLADPGIPGGPSTWVHTVAVLTLITLTVRWSAVRQAAPAVGVAAISEALLGLQITQPPPSGLDAVALTLFWSIGTAGAVGLGAYLRILDRRRVDAVTQARRTQRLQLARDLHDFVAHDVSAIVIQAQAAQILLDRDPAEAAAALRAIEEDGARALASMDRTVRMLRELEGDSASAEPLPGLDDLPDLVRRFADAGFPDTEMRVGPSGPVPREVGTTIYRIVVEALTNVRKHAPAGSSVTIQVSDETGAVVVTVADRADGQAHGHTHGQARDQALLRLPSAERAGVGLVGLAERVQALGGEFASGPAAGGGWVVKAVFP